MSPELRRLFIDSVVATSLTAVKGYAVGCVVAFTLVAVTVALPPLRDGLYRLAVIVSWIPLIAVGPILVVTLGREDTASATAAIGPFFMMFVATTSGLAAASPSQRDVLYVLGSSSRSRFRLLELPAALPMISTGMKLAAPAALLGAILGEWFGAPRGLGVIIVSSMQNFQMTQLWAAALIGSTVSLTAFGLMSVLERSVRVRMQ